MNKRNPEIGPIYGVELLTELPLDGGMIQAMPSRKDLEAARIRSERTVAGFEVLTEHYRRATNKLATIPDWHAKPTCAGRWLSKRGQAWIVTEEMMTDSSPWALGPYYGPIPGPPGEDGK